MYELIRERITQSVSVKRGLLENEALLKNVERMAAQITKALKNGNKLVLCGNGGSASDALHFAGEIVGRFQMERPAWPAVVLNADVASMTAIGNDYGFDEVFARQAEGIVSKGDVFVGISTSGNSENVLRAMHVAGQKEAITVALTGRDGGKMANEADISIVIPCETTARIQECHILLIHIVCELVESGLTRTEV